MKQSPSRFKQLIQTTKTHVQEVDVHTLKNLIETGRAPHLIDVRETYEWQASEHLPRAIHLSKGVIEQDIEKHIPSHEADIVVYCSGGFRSLLVAENLGKMGYQHVISMQGGLAAWKEAGYPLDTNE